MTPDGFDDVSPQFAAELIDHAGDPRPAGVKGVRCDSLVDLAGGEHLPWPTGQQEQNIKLHPYIDKICQRSTPVWLMSVLQIRRAIPYNVRKAVAEVRKTQAGKVVTKREDMEKAFPSVLSTLNLVVVARCGLVEKCRARGQHNINHGAKAYLLSPRDNCISIRQCFCSFRADLILPFLENTF